jgi:hypothetical protein
VIETRQLWAEKDTVVLEDDDEEDSGDEPAVLPPVEEGEEC